MLSDYSSVIFLKMIGCKHIPSFLLLMKVYTWNLYEMSFSIIMLWISSECCHRDFDLFLDPCIRKTQHVTHWNFMCVYVFTENRSSLYIYMCQMPAQFFLCCHSSISTGVNNEIIGGLIPCHSVSGSWCRGLDRLLGSVNRTASLLMLLLTPVVFLPLQFEKSAVEKGLLLV